MFLDIEQHARLRQYGNKANIAEVVDKSRLVPLYTYAGNLATDGFTNPGSDDDNSRMKHVRARLPLVSQTVTFSRLTSNSF